MRFLGIICLLLAGCGSAGGSSEHDSRALVKIVAIGADARQVTQDAIPELVEKYATVGIELNPEFYYFDAAPPAVMPDPYDPYYFKLRQLVGTDGAMLVIVNSRLQSSFYPATATIDGLSTPGCCQRYCHAVMVVYPNNPSGQADLMAYELSHQFGTPGVFGNQDGDETLLAGRDVTNEIQEINSGGANAICHV